MSGARRLFEALMGIGLDREALTAAALLCNALDGEHAPREENETDAAKELADLLERWTA